MKLAGFLYFMTIVFLVAMILVDRKLQIEYKMFWSAVICFVGSILVIWALDD